jgi:hypothetical protein
MPAPPPTASTRSQRILASFLGGIAAIVVIALGTILVLRRDAVPELTPTAFEAAEARWGAAGCANYTIETQVRGMQPATYRVEVRDGAVVSATRNGNPLRDRRTLGTWSVPGMFGTIESDLQTNAEADPGQSPLQLRAEFHPTYGFPQRYVRLAWGSKVTTSWQVQSFTMDEVEDETGAR